MGKGNITDCCEGERSKHGLGEEHREGKKGKEWNLSWAWQL